MSSLTPSKALTVPVIRARKGQLPLTMLTAYDHPTAYRLDEAGIDLILVGDSVATVVQGRPNTLQVSLDQMVYHTSLVSRGAQRALVVGDLPFMSYQINAEDALRSAARLIQEGGARAVKLEGGREMAETVRTIVRAGIPVMGHIGLTPQSIHVEGAYRTHGKTPEEREELLDSARALTHAGAFAVVLECVEASLAHEITQTIGIPTIGIGSGSQCDGQVLVTSDLLGLTLGHVPRFVRVQTNLGEQMSQAIREFINLTQEHGRAGRNPE